MTVRSASRAFLPRGARVAAVELADNVARAFGYVVRVDGPDLGDLRRARLLRTYGIDAVIDIGAFEGQYALELRRGGFGGHILSFEPLVEPFSRLSAAARDDGQWDVCRSAVGATRGSLTMNVAGNGMSSSVLPMAQLHVDNYPESAYRGREEVPVLTVDEIGDEYLAAHQHVLLKADTQGYELEVLRGARKLLQRAVLVEVEMSLSVLYEGGPLIADVITYLRNAGFSLISLQPEIQDHVSGHLLQANGIFLRDGSAPLG